MARGIDGIAQKAALDAGGKSYAVLGCGVDICYPEENRDLYERLQQQGGILSEYPPGMQPIAKLFPPRNRIISGLSDLVLVIEARKRSGTLITVDMALEQGREVYALPGRVSDALSDGCNRLIRQGAGPATCPEDILEFFFGTGSEEERESIKKQDMGRPDENREWEDSHGVVDSEKTSSESLDRRILHLLSLEDEKHIERILEEIRKLDSPGESEKSEDSISLPELVSCLMRLKIDGRVEESSAGYYRKI
jgi:DNA processing protein